jgi:membrane protease YdiL (CAAX protease family)
MNPMPRTPVAGRIASNFHTGLFVALFASLAVAGAVLQAHLARQPGSGATSGTPHSQPLSLYLGLIAMEIGLFSFVRGGIGRYHVSVWGLVGRAGTSLRSISTDAAIALAFWLAWSLIQWAWGQMGPPDSATEIYSLPRSPLAIGLWIAVSVAAGISEEFAFRGYLQRQLTTLCGRVGWAIVLQALLFGMAHSYEGWQCATRIVLFGLLAGMLAQWRKSLRPGMMAHGLTDIMAGLFGL